MEKEDEEEASSGARPHHWSHTLKEAQDAQSDLGQEEHAHGHQILGREKKYIVMFSVTKQEQICLMSYGMIRRIENFFKRS